MEGEERGSAVMTEGGPVELGRKIRVFGRSLTDGAERGKEGPFGQYGSGWCGPASGRGSLLPWGVCELWATRSHLDKAGLRWHTLGYDVRFEEKGKDQASRSGRWTGELIYQGAQSLKCGTKATSPLQCEGTGFRRPVP